MAEILGIDIYEGDGAVDWAAVRQNGYRFGIAKATEGATIQDSAFQHHWKTMKQEGVVRGAYHFLHVGTSSASDQAANFLQQLGHLEPGDLPPVVDIEVDDGQSSVAVLEAAVTWLSAVEKALSQQTGKKIKPIVYTFPDFWDNIGNPDLSDYPLWIANYTDGSPTIPDCWQGAWLLHQYAGDVDCAGVENQADISRWNEIQQNNNSKLVSDVQQRLAAHEYAVGAIDGSFGPQTKKAVVAFQKAHSLTEDGVIGLDTWLKLIWS